jgi:hypothetical protein
MSACMRIHCRLSNEASMARGSEEKTRLDRERRGGRVQREVRPERAQLLSVGRNERLYSEAARVGDG